MNILLKRRLIGVGGLTLHATSAAPRPESVSHPNVLKALRVEKENRNVRRPFTSGTMAADPTA